MVSSSTLEPPFCIFTRRSPTSAFHVCLTAARSFPFGIMCDGASSASAWMSPAFSPQATSRAAPK
eukprot:CAMPEP_0179339048 /NCGR_PEP_ID=MMETSP0797-20121207/68504_1 /TAXON_ID=47934 /ORGANISM="Dinophysis acuminata, Strain DAEP01" /LENGTH=64 /DNA_ID=CAMNT_0021052847 /DNA_START=175 /DNA_END=366 /DNA_ORIENTATION=-